MEIQRCGVINFDLINSNQIAHITERQIKKICIAILSTDIPLLE